MFRKILIANRGEIAVRVLRACNDLGIETVAIYSSVDRAAPHVRRADEAYNVGGPAATDSYLKMDRIIDVAGKSGAEAIHPGYGFLAENAEFADRCAAAGLVFIGPPPAAMRAMGDKVEARRRMIAAGVPTLPGTDALPDDRAVVERAAQEIGYPVILKAAAGGGGKGMRVVERPADLSPALERARSEARASFGNATVYLERFVRRPRHIEVQVLFDAHGNGVALGERECSIQRRHQKILEETPSVVVDAALRRKLGDLACAAARAADYVNAGTVEFLRDEDGSFYFMEVNARLQVEHPVTEMVYGVDLVAEQIRVAAGAKLPWTQEQLVPRGHAIEVRITAEDPEHNFMPCPGRIDALRIPSGPGIRDDSAIAPGSQIPLEYDPMIGKLIAHGENREQAIQRLRRALDEYRIEGLKTNISFLSRLLDLPEFVRGELHTGFLEQHGKKLLAGEDRWLEEAALVAAAIHAYRQRVESALRSQAAGESGRPRSAWLERGRERALEGRR